MTLCNIVIEIQIESEAQALKKEARLVSSLRNQHSAQTMQKRSPHASGVHIPTLKLNKITNPQSDSQLPLEVDQTPPTGQLAPQILTKVDPVAKPELKCASSVTGPGSGSDSSANSPLDH